VARQEIVGAVIDSEQITSDMAAILRSAAAGRQVDYISRRRAETIASFRGGEAYRELARSATLFVVDNGVRFVPSFQ
jgi:hypothetical protein